MWLQRPPTRMYWRRGGEVFSTRPSTRHKAARLSRRLFLEFAANRFIFRRGALRGMAHWLIMWGCIAAAAITFPLVWGWIEFRTVPGRFDLYRTFVFGFPAGAFPIESWIGFVIF